MSKPTLRRRAVALTALASLACLGAAAGTTSAAAAPKPKPSRYVDLQVLSFNDFHGNLEPPTGSSGRLTTSTGTVDAGGVAYLATHLKQLRQGHKNSLTVAAGDLIGASPAVSGLFKDEPAVETLNALKLDVSSVGNHEFDEGVNELLRMQYGGCHPTEGCFDADGYSGAKYDYLAANVAYTKGVKVKAPKGSKHYGSWFGAKTGRTVLPPTEVKNVGGVPVGFIGMTLEGTPEIVAAAGIKDVSFADEVKTANLAAQDLRRQGVKAIVVLLHEGGIPPAGATYDYACNTGTAAAISGPVVDIAKKIDPSVDLLVTGHTHNAYTCDIPDPSGASRYVTSAASFGRLITETDLKLDKISRDVVRSSVKPVQHAVTRDVTPDAAETAIVDRWRTAAAPVLNVPIGSITADITRTAAPSGESALNNLIPDAQLAASSAVATGGAQIAFMNPGGVRTDLVFAGSPAGEGNGVVTYGEAFSVQPFGNTLTTMTLTGTQIDAVLEQQWTAARTIILGGSSGFTYSYSPTAAVGSRVDPASIKLNGTALSPTGTYRVTVNSFLADGGDGFTVLRDGTSRLGGVDDLLAFTNYLQANSPVAPPATDRITVTP